MNAVVDTLRLPQQDLASPSEATGAALMMNGDALDRMLRAAEVMATAAVTLPQHLRGKPGDCLAIIMQANQWGMNPFAVAQKTHIVNGALGYEAQLVNAVIVARAPLRERLRFEWFPEGAWKIKGKEDKSPEHGVRVYATLRGETEPRVLEVTMAQVGVRNSPLWVDDPRQQIAYLATKRWARLYCPDVILGVYTPDELDEIGATERDMGLAEVVQPAGATRTDQVKSMLGGQAKASAVEKSPLQAFVDKVNAAGTLEALNALKEEGERLTDPADNAAGAKAWKDRRAFLRAARGKVETIDATTGEVVKPEPLTLAAFTGLAQAAKTRAELLEVGVRIEELPESHRGEADQEVQRLLRGLPD